MIALNPLLVVLILDLIGVNLVAEIAEIAFAVFLPAGLAKQELLLLLGLNFFELNSVLFALGVGALLNFLIALLLRLLVLDGSTLLALRLREEALLVKRILASLQHGEQAIHALVLIIVGRLQIRVGESYWKK